MLVISGGPGVSERKTNALLHHRVKTFETQRNVYAEVCCRASIIHNPADAPRIIGETIAADQAAEPPRLHRDPAGPVPRGDRAGDGAEPAAAGGPGGLVRVGRRGHGDAQQGVGPDHHRGDRGASAAAGGQGAATGPADRRTAGQHAGEQERAGENARSWASTPGRCRAARRFASASRQSDCVLMLGAFMTEFDMGVYTAHLDPRRTISVSTEQCQISLSHLSRRCRWGRSSMGCWRARTCRVDSAPRMKRARTASGGARPADGEKITIKSLYRLIDERLSDEHVVVCDVGDCLFAAIGLHVPNEAGLIAPANYTSMGFGVPGAIGAELGSGKRPIVLVGDGAFQMTGTETVDRGAVRAFADRDRAEQRDVPDAEQHRPGRVQPDRPVGLREVHGLDVPGARLPRRDGRAVRGGVRGGEATDQPALLDVILEPRRPERDPLAVRRGTGQAGDKRTHRRQPARRPAEKAGWRIANGKDQ